MHWVIQDKVFGDETNELIKHLSSYELVNDVPSGLRGPSPYIARGTVEFVNNFNKHWSSWSSYQVFVATLLDIDNYRCSKYYPLVPNLLNQDFILLPWWKLKESKDLLNQVFPNFDRLFIRPDEGVKIFTGTTVGAKWFSKELKIIEELPSSNIKYSDLVLISSAKKVNVEARFMMDRNKIVSWSHYSEDSFFTKEQEEKAFSLVKSNTYYPNTLYTIDVGMVENEEDPKIIEINSFCSAGLYDMDYSLVAKAVELLEKNIK